MLAAALILPATAMAADTPRPGVVDPRIRFVNYDPDEVVLLRGFFGYQTMIEFGADERIENVAIGDAMGWQVTPNKRATLLFVKPTQKGAATNMTVVTDKRRYAFQLAMAPASARREMAYVVRFRYPAPPVVLAEAPPPPPAPETLNFAYSFKGATAIQPARVFDDGQATYFAWPPGIAAPAIFAIGPDGREETVNSQVRGDYTVVEQLSPTFMLRLGKAVTTVTNGGYGRAAAVQAPAPEPSAMPGASPADGDQR